VGIYPLRVYADTSVFGGAFDEEFREPTRRSFDEIVEGRFTLVTSVLVRDEPALAPDRVREFARGILAQAEIAEVCEAATALRTAYLSAGVVSNRWETDALHVAVATVESCALIVSWNFAHHVNVDRIRKYCAVNALEGYGPVDIRTPAEVVHREEDL
jgi:predicted nucleic acid-binding protein